MLNFVLQQAPLAFGLAEGVDPHQAPFGTLMTAENVRWGREGRAEKRRGLVQCASVPSGKALRLAVSGSELLAFSRAGAGLQALSATSAAWAQKYFYPELCPTTRPIRDDVAGILFADTATLSDGTQITAWVTGPATSTGGKLYFQRTDANGIPKMDPLGAILVNPTGATSVLGLRVVSDGTTFAIIYATAAGIFCINGTTSTTNAAVSLYGSGFASAGPLDAFVSNGTLYVAYSSNTNNVTVATFNLTTLAAGLSTTSALGTNPVTISIDGASTDLVHVLSSTTTTVQYAAITASTMVVLVALATVDTTQANIVGVLRSSSTGAYLVWSNDYTKDTLAIVSGSSVSFGSKVPTAFQTIVSKPFFIGSMGAYVLTTSTHNGYFGSDTSSLGYTGGDINVVALSTINQTRVAAKVETLTGTFWGTIFTANVSAVSSTKVRIMYPSLSAIYAGGSGTNAYRASARELVLTTDGANAPDFLRCTDIGPETYIGAGALCSYDGVEAAPVNMSHPSFFASLVPSTTGGNIAAGTYLYNTYAERRSSVGILHRGPTAVAQSATTTSATASVALTMAGVWLSLLASGIAEDIAVFRSVVGGSLPQRLSKLAPANVYSTTVTKITVTDTDSDATQKLSAQPVVYTATGELDDYQPPSALTLCEFQRRLWMLAPDGRTLWFSKDPTLNPGIAPGFHPSFTITLSEPVVAIRAMDANLVVFTSTGLYVIQGDGPAPNGQGASYQSVKVQTDVGCITARSVVTMPDGLMFQSTRGLYLLTRGLEVQFVGGPVQTQSSGVNVTSAVLVATQGEVRFTLSSGTNLAYNYLYKKWSTTKYTLTSGYGVPVVDAAVWQGAYTIMDNDGGIWVESSTSFLDGSAWVPMTLETTWNNAAGPLAYQSVRNFSCEGVANTNHDLTVSVGFDNEPSYAQTVTFPADSEVTSIGPLESCDVSIGTRRKCQSIRFMLQDATPSGGFAVGTGQGPSFDSLGVEVGVKQGFRAKPAGRTG